MIRFPFMPDSVDGRVPGPGKPSCPRRQAGGRIEAYAVAGREVRAAREHLFAMYGP